MYFSARVAVFYSALVFSAGMLVAQTIDLPSSKQLVGEIPGHPRRLNSLPISMTVSPDSRYVVTVNAGYGVYESQYMQSLAVLDTQNATQTGAVADFPDSRTLVRARQTLFSGLAFSRDGTHLYASMASLTDPLANGKDATGNGIVVYSFTQGKIAPERFIPLPLQQLAPGKTTRLRGGAESDKGIPYPAAIAVIGSAAAEKLLVADNLSDDVLLLDAASGKIETRFDLAENDAVPSTYPIALALSKNGARAYVALWNASEIVELDLAKGTVGRKLALLKPSSPMAPGSHPCAFELSPDGRTLYVALANSDAVAAVNLSRFSVRGYFSTRLPHQSYFGAEPVALTINASGSRLYVANLGSDAIAVFDTSKLTPKTARSAMVEPLGFIPTEWMPISLTFSGGKLYLATDKGKGTGPNNMPQPPTESTKNSGLPRPFTFIATLLYGSLATLDESAIDKNLSQWTATVLESNRMNAAGEKIAFAGGKPNPIRHVIYILKENRTYDQLFGDLKQDGKPIGNGDPSLAMYGETITPNQHKLALQFGVLDNFYDSAEVSSGGHVWSIAAIGTDYLERTWQQGYRGNQRTYDSEGMVANGNPLLQQIPDVSDPASGYIWNNLAAHGKTYYHFGEYISSTFCNAAKVTDPQAGAMLPGGHCPRNAVAPGETFPAEWGGGVNKWPWPVPLLATNTATKQELVGHFAVEAPDFNLMIPDQVRVEIFLRHLQGWVADYAQGKDAMPNFIMLRLGNDHTRGTQPGGPSPKSSVADNDLAVGRAVEAVSHSPFWDSTAIFILEDDAQNGADHVDAHRSIALVISKYSPRGKAANAPGAAPSPVATSETQAPSNAGAPFTAGAPFVDSRFYSTVSVIRTMESLLDLPPMNNNDAFSSLISTLFTGPGDQPPFVADYSNRDNGLIYTANLPTAAGARESMKMDFTHADHAPADKLNVILWKDAMGDKPVPAMLKVHHKKAATDDDD
jgi:DNA-binding beta-propeller fold protein YncE